MGIQAFWRSSGDQSSGGFQATKTSTTPADPALTRRGGGQTVIAQAASTSQMWRLETEALAKKANVTTLADLSGRWIDVESSVNPTHGEQDGGA
jgi:hypothetical protein